VRELTLRQVLQIVRARWRLCLSVFAAVVGLVAVLTFAWPRSYDGVVSVVVDPKDTSLADLVTGSVTSQQAGVLANSVATEVEVINSHTVAAAVVDRFKLTEQANVIAQLSTVLAHPPAGATALRDWLAERLLKHVDVTPVKDSRVIAIAYSSPDPRFAAVIANAFADAYIDTSLELKVDPARRQAAWFQQQTQELRANLEVAQQRLSDFQRKNSIAGADDKLDVENANLAGISSQLINAQADADDAQSKLKQLELATEKQQLDELPDVLGSSTLQSMKIDLERAEGQFADIAQRYDHNHPTYRSALAQVDSLKNKMRQELADATGSIRQRAEIAEQRGHELQKSVERHKSEILRLKQLRDQADVMARDVQNAQRTFDDAIQRAGAVKLEGQLNQSSIAILSPAIVPLSPARPKVFLNLALALFLGSCFGVAAAVIAESTDGRVRSAAGLVAATDLVVLGEVPRFAAFIASPANAGA
jgi:succinoglycan biosynthesis transport protein ExoP